MVSMLQEFDVKFTTKDQMTVSEMTKSSDETPISKADKSMEENVKPRKAAKKGAQTAPKPKLKSKRKE